MKRFLHSFQKISPEGLAAVRIVLAFAGAPGVDSYGQYRLARALAETPAGVLLLAGIGLIIAESPR